MYVMTNTETQNAHTVANVIANAAVLEHLLISSSMSRIFLTRATETVRKIVL